MIFCFQRPAADVYRFLLCRGSALLLFLLYTWADGSPVNLGKPTAVTALARAGVGMPAPAA